MEIVYIRDDGGETIDIYTLEEWEEFYQYHPASWR